MLRTLMTGILTLTTIAMLAPSVTFAQDEKEEAKGKTIKGELMANDQDHAIEFQKGKAYTIDMTSDQFDTFLILKDDSGAQVAFDDDGGAGLNSKIFYAAPKTGKYTIVASSFGKGGQGPYTITIAESKINVVDTIQGNMNQNKVPHKIKLVKGKTYTIDMVSGQFDTYLYLEDPNGQEVADDDDGGAGLNSKIVYEAKEDGEYTIQASSFGNSGVGAYTITVSEGAQAAPNRRDIETEESK